MGRGRALPWYKGTDWQKRNKTAEWGKILDHYGRKCNCCKEDDPRFLTVDHIDCQVPEMESVGRKLQGERLRHWLVKNDFPEGYQLLCFNCNLATYHNGGVCPHKDQRVAVARIHEWVNAAGG